MALDLNGSSQYANRAHSASLNMNFAHTVEAWVKYDATQASRFVVCGKSRGGGLVSAMFFLNNTSYNLWISDSSGSDRGLSLGSVIRSDGWPGWFHVGWRLALTGSTMQFLLNGYTSATVATSETSIQTQSGNWYVGGDGTGDYFNGKIQEIRVWDANLSANQLATMWNKRLIDHPDLLAAQANLRCYWPLVNDYNDYGVQGLNLGLTGVGSPTFVSEDPDWIDLPQVVDEDAPVLSGVTPAEGSQINGDTALQLDVTDETALAGVELAVFFGGDYADYDERIHDGTSFTARYAAGSTRTSISGGYRYVLRRAGGWLVDPTLSVRAWDGGGNVLTETIAYSRPAAGTPAPSGLQSRKGTIPFGLRDAARRFAA